jgi:WD40 repeat protein
MAGKDLQETPFKLTGTFGLFFSFVLVSASKDCTVKLWDLMEDGNMFRSLAPKEVIKPIKQVAWSPDAQRFATVGDGKIVCRLGILFSSSLSSF